MKGVWIFVIGALSAVTVMALPRVAAHFLQANACDLIAEQSRRPEAASLKSDRDYFRFRFAKEQSGQSGGIDDLNGHPDRRE